MNKLTGLWMRAWFVFAIGILSGCGSDQGGTRDPSGPAVGTASEELCANAGLAASVSSYVANPGTSVTWTGTASCSMVNPQFRFVYKNPAGTWIQAQDWSTANTYVWNTTGFATGIYSWQVWVRESGSTATYETYTGKPFTLSSASGVCSTVTASASPTSPSVPGTAVTITGSGTCSGGATPQYRFLEKAPGATSYTEVKAYSASNSFAWTTTGLAVGTYTFLIYVRAQGSPADYEAYAAVTYELNANASCTAPTLTASPANQTLVGNMVTLTAGSSTCTSPQYRFLVLPPGSSTWTELQAYSSSSTFNWSTTSLAAGTYSLQVWVRATGHTNSFDAYTTISYKLTTTPACTNATLGASPASPQVRGTSVTFNAGSSTCPAPRYRFIYRNPAGTWIEGQPYGATSSYIWNTTSLSSGTYTIQVWVRDSASTNSYDTFTTLSYTLTFTATAPTAPKLTAGQNHTCVVRSGGAVDCWGWNSNGQLGDGTTTTRPTGTAVSGISGATSLGSSYIASCAVMADTSAKCWGNNADGQLGNGTTTQSTTPVAVSGLTGVVALSSGGAAHECAALSDGTVHCWGYNSQGQLGDQSSVAFSSTPVTVTGLTGVVQVAAGYYHTCALTNAGVVRCWGYNVSGQLGNGTTTSSKTPVTVTGITDARAIAASNGYSCALLFDGSVSCWGSSVANPASSTPVAVSGVSSATSLSVGPSHACAVLSSGGVVCWGGNSHGELGNGTTTNSASAVAVSGLTGTTASFVAAGNQHSCTLFSDGTANCWGYGVGGVLGNGTNVDSLTPVSVTLP